MAAEFPAGRAQPGPQAGVEDGAPGGAPVLDQGFDAGSLYLLRAAVAAHASAAGLSPLRVYDVVAAAHELAANAVLHGAGRGRLYLRCNGAVLYCQVSDDGQAGRDQDPGQDPGGTPAWPVRHGHGLWLIAQVTDQFSIDHGPAGTTATAGFTISSPQPGAGP